jgi:chemotaxis protein methyltransferase CheR
MADFTFTDADFESFRNLIYNESGIHFTQTNRSILEGRLREKLREKNIATPGEYFRKISTDSGELRAFLDAVTTNLTRFFRNQPHFDALEKYVLPDLMKFKKPLGDFKIKIWSAGCSSGEEPYTIAMLLEDKLPQPWTFDIVASDLSLKMLMTAKEGFYDEHHIVGVPDAYLTRFFDKVTGGYRVKDDLKKKIRFDYHNLHNASTWRGMDIVFCRNVLIYFDEAAQTAVVNRFYDSMSSHSYLFIGHSESLFGMDTKFQFVKTQWTTFDGKGVNSNG